MNSILVCFDLYWIYIYTYVSRYSIINILFFREREVANNVLLGTHASHHRRYPLLVAQARILYWVRAIVPTVLLVICVLILEKALSGAHWAPAQMVSLQQRVVRFAQLDHIVLRQSKILKLFIFFLSFFSYIFDHFLAEFFSLNFLCWKKYFWQSLVEQFGVS